jgi:hypothetical protein
MSDGDGFIHEVTEELRRDRMLKLWRSFAPVVIGGVVAIVAVTALVEWNKASDRASAETAGAVLLAAAMIQSDDAKAAGFAEAAASLENGPAMIARLSQASAAAQAGDDETAVRALGDVAGEGSGGDEIYRDLAAFRAALAALPALSPEARIDALTPFLVEGAPFRLLALEQRAVARLEANDMAGARSDAEAALSDPMASGQMRRRLDFFVKLLPAGDGA